jgi:hypothetical protein
MLVLLIVADLMTGFLSVALMLEDSNFHREHPQILAALIGICTFGFNWGTNTMHWVFSFKYWVVANEIPKFFQGEMKSRESTYRFINITV